MILKKLLNKYLSICLILLNFSFLNAQINVSLPDTSVIIGEIVLIPISVDVIQESDSVFAFQGTLKYNDNVINILGVNTSGTLSDKWGGNTILNNRGDGELFIGSFGAYNIYGQGILLYLNVEVVGQHLNSSILELDGFIFNAGQPSVIVNNGTVNVLAPQRSISITTNTNEQINVIVDGDVKQTPFDTTWYSGTEHSIGIETPQYINQESRIAFESWNDTVDTIHVVSPVSDTVFQCNVATEYLVTLNSDYGSVHGAGWYRQADTVTISVDTLITFGDTTQFVFTGWDGSGQGSYTGENYTANIIINEPIFENAQWTTQHFVALNSLFGDPVGEGWYDEGDTVEIKIDTLVYLNENTRLKFNSWEASGSGSYSGTSAVANIFINGPIIENATWDKQFYLSVFATPEHILSFDETGWYMENELGIEIIAPNIVELTDVKYRFINWVVDEQISNQNPITVQMESPHILNAVYQIDSVLVGITADAGENISVYVDNILFSLPYSKFWKFQSEHIVGIDSIVFLPDSLSRYVFDLWDDGGDLFHNVKADSIIKLSVKFTQQHYLLVETIPAGLIEYEETGWYVDGDSVQLPKALQQIFTEVDSFKFNSWMIDDRPVAGNPIEVVMNTNHYAAANYENLYFISGTVTNSRGLPAKGVEFVLSGTKEDTVQSSEKGDYFFSTLTQGDYRVTPYFENFEFITSFLEYPQLQSSQNEQNFVAVDILEPNVTLLYPNGGQWIKKSTTDTIKWTAIDNIGVDSIAIELTVDGGVNWQRIAEFDSGATHQFIWTVPDTVSAECFIKIHAFDFDDNNAWDMSDSMFTIGSETEVADLLNESKIPMEFTVQQNYPNPFNNTTVIPFHLPKSSYVTIDIYNVNGQKVQTIAAKNFKPGLHRISWNGLDQFGKNVSSGIYLYRVEALEKIVIKKFLYVR